MLHNTRSATADPYNYPATPRRLQNSHTIHQDDPYQVRLECWCDSTYSPLFPRCCKGGFVDAAAAEVGCVYGNGVGEETLRLRGDYL